MSDTEDVAGDVDLGTLLNDAESLMDSIVDIRRRIHANPETGLDLPATQELVMDELGRMGLVGRFGRSCSSVTAVIEGEADGPTVLLRADMDALEIPEQTGLDFSSRVPGLMHACGHDAHTAMLLGAARLLLKHRDDLRGKVILMFQPGEEGYDGARIMLDEGLMDVHGSIDRAFAIHVAPSLASGTIACREGLLLGTADEFSIVVQGEGGHAGLPHTAIDPVPAACEIGVAVHAMITRTIDVFDPALVTVSTIHGGTTYNAMPDEVVLGGTIRAASEHSRTRVIEALGSLVEHTAMAHRCRGELRLAPVRYPATVNDATQARHVLSVAEQMMGTERSLPLPSPILGSEDWSYVLNQVPGAMAMLGVAPAGMDEPPPHHSSQFVIDESAMATGAAIYAAMGLVSPPIT